jgi:hypothetical protein
MFNVAMRPLLVSVDNRQMPVRDSQAIVEMPSGRVVSVVGRGYRLVSHAEALGLAYDCARAAFPETKPSEWQVASVDAPSTGGTCFIDLAHNSAALDFTGLAANDKPEVFGPFVRVTNSYNRTRALCFDIGYSRKVCKNGLILRSSLISFKMSHQRREIQEAVKFEIAHDKLAKQKQEFQAFLGRLQACPVPTTAIAGFASDVLGFQAPATHIPPTDTRWVAWSALAKVVAAASGRYEKELGANAYAVLNVVTELASRPPDNTLVRRDRHALQRRAGEWASDFSSKCIEDKFDLGQYLAALKQRRGVSSPAVTATSPRR